MQEMDDKLLRSGGLAWEWEKAKLQEKADLADRLRKELDVLHSQMDHLREEVLCLSVLVLGLCALS